MKTCYESMKEAEFNKVFFFNFVFKQSRLLVVVLGDCSDGYRNGEKMQRLDEKNGSSLQVCLAGGIAVMVD